MDVEEEKMQKNNTEHVYIMIFITFQNTSILITVPIEW